MTPVAESTMASPPENQWHRLLQFSTIGLEMGLSVVLGLLIGNYLDRWLDTAPWMLMIFLMLGFAAGFRRLFSLARKYHKEISKDYNDE